MLCFNESIELITDCYTFSISESSIQREEEEGEDIGEVVRVFAIKEEGGDRATTDRRIR